ncbi:MAG: hypothetical protein DI577_05745 [Microbacterium sp.]|nr:MAG: hypothetical protein DI577_05745 [Microbacterium sp.]PZU36128.1 MAG: hypothetical protein DI575_05745 [Microbacterium sp.]
MLAFFLALGVLASAGLWGFFIPFVLIAIVATVGMFFPRTRPSSTGVLIIVAAAWIVVLGPCLAIIAPR